jgi:hypothetical protein
MNASIREGDSIMPCHPPGKSSANDTWQPPGRLGDAKPIGGGLSEFRVDYGPGYRLYSCSTAVV